MNPSSLQYIIYERFLSGGRVYRDQGCIYFTYSRWAAGDNITYNLTLNRCHPVSAMAFIYRYANV
jgi:hypothetical protein